MISRKSLGKITKDKNEKRFISTAIYPTITPTGEDLYFISKAGDRLDTYAYRYYKDARYWKILAQANHLGKGSFIVPAGIQIRIPVNPEKIKIDIELFQKLR